jgi:hypothetical protein
MTMQPAKTVKYVHVLCPHCPDNQKGKRVDHIKPGGTAGPWYCDDCGHGYRVEVLHDGTVLIDPIAERLIHRHVLLQILPQKEPIFVLVKGMRFSTQDGGPDAQAQHDAFHYEENSCPTNHLRSVQQLMVGDETDPHGILRVVSAKDAEPGDFAHYSSEAKDKRIREMVAASKGTV